MIYLFFFFLSDIHDLFLSMTNHQSHFPNETLFKIIKILISKLPFSSVEQTVDHLTQMHFPFTLVSSNLKRVLTNLKPLQSRRIVDSSNRVWEMFWDAFEKYSFQSTDNKNRSKWGMQCSWLPHDQIKRPLARGMSNILHSSVNSEKLLVGVKILQQLFLPFFLIGSSNSFYLGPTELHLNLSWYIVNHGTISSYPTPPTARPWTPKNSRQSHLHNAQNCLIENPLPYQIFHNSLVPHQYNHWEYKMSGAP